MHWHLPERRRKLLRNYSRALTSREYSKSDKRYVLYLLLRPSLTWFKNALKKKGLEEDETESEVYILTDRLLNRYDPTRSSFVPYIEKQLPWMASRAIYNNKELREVPCGIDIDMGSYEIEQEVCLSVPNILLENRWIARDLSFSEKNLILRLLTADDSSCRTLANGCGESKSSINNRLNDLSDKLKGRF
jgi:hypothetical protein